MGLYMVWLIGFDGGISCYRIWLLIGITGFNSRMEDKKSAQIAVQLNQNSKSFRFQVQKPNKHLPQSN